MSYFETEEKNKKISAIVSTVMHILILLLFFLPLMTQTKPIQDGGIVLDFGTEDAGSDSEDAESQPQETAASSPKPAPSPSKQTEVASVDRDEVAPVKAKEKESKPKPPKEESPKPVKNNEEEAKRKAEQDRIAAEKAKADREAEEMNKKKQKYSDLLGKGKGNNNTSGNQGSEKGNPDGSALEGITKGTGRVGEGLSNRGVEYTPTFTDNSQKTGRVILRICVNSEGKVIKADFTQKGSTTSDAYLIDLARKTALKYRFSKSENAEQCGNITIDFKTQ